MFSVDQKRRISQQVQDILRATNDPGLPYDEIDFVLHVDGAAESDWADIKNNGAVFTPSVNPHPERQAR